MKTFRLASLTAIFLVLACSGQTVAQNFSSMRFKRATVDQVSVFYREAGDRSKPTILFLHGFPSSSHMFRNVMTHLADEYYVIAPDYPGFGFSDSPSHSQYNYTFDNIANTIEIMVKNLGLSKLYLYVQDYGGPVGFRIALRNPELVAGLIIQNANAYEIGFGEVTRDFRNYFQKPSVANEKKVRQFLTLDGTRFQYLDGAGDSSRIAPESWMLDYTLLSRPGNDEIQLALFRDYVSNIKSYDKWQKYFRSHNPPTLIVWGANDKIFTANGAIAFKTDLPDAQIHLLKGGHFVLEEEHEQIARLIKKFIKEVK